MRSMIVVVVAVAAIAASTAVAATGLPRFAGCSSFTSPTATGSVRPASIVLACGDGNFYLTGIRWTVWNAQRATGVGVGHQNDCTPYCAAGKFHTYRVSIRLDERRLCGASRRAQLTRASWAFVGPKPAQAARRGSERFRCAGS